MPLVYKKSTASAARKYERSSGMEPNVGGVTHMTVINPGRPRPNPFQWITGSSRGRNTRVSPQYTTMRGARNWAEKHTTPDAKLVAVDEFGSIVTRPLSRKQVLKKNSRRKTMAYDLERLKRAMRQNVGRSGSSEPFLPAFPEGRGGPFYPSSPWKTESEYLTFMSRRSPSSTKPKGKESKVKKRTSRKASSKKVTSKKVGAKGVVAAAKSAVKHSAVAKASAVKAKKTTSKVVATKAAKVAAGAAKKASKAASKATSKASKPGSKPAAKKAATRARKAASTAVVAAVGAKKAALRMSSRSPRISRRTGTHRVSAAPSPVYRLLNKPYTHITGFERVKRGSTRSQRPMQRKRKSKRVTPNLLARVGHRNGMPTGKHIQVVQFGPKSKRKGYATYIPGHVSERSYVRKFTFGGAARAAHSRALRDGYRKSKKTSKKPVKANGRHSMRRNSKRRSSKRRSRRLHSNRYVVRNRHRGLRRNMTVFGVDPVSQIMIPGLYAVTGLMATNAAANAAANMEGVRNLLDRGRSPDEALYTKLAVGALATGGVIAFSGKLPAMVRNNLGSLIAGMGCAVAVRLFRGNTSFAPLAPYLGTWGAGFGEYVDQPLGAYVTDPSMGEYVDQPLGEYVDQPLGAMYAAAGMGGVDGLMDVMEAAAGVGAYEAAAGTMYAAAGLGIPSFTPPRGPNGYQQPAFVSTHTPVDVARDVEATMPRTIQIRPSLMAPEAGEGGGGLFSRSIFGPMG